MTGIRTRGNKIERLILQQLDHRTVIMIKTCHQQEVWPDAKVTCYAKVHTECPYFFSKKEVVWVVSFRHHGENISGSIILMRMHCLIHFVAHIELHVEIILEKLCFFISGRKIFLVVMRYLVSVRISHHQQYYCEAGFTYHSTVGLLHSIWPTSIMGLLRRLQTLGCSDDSRSVPHSFHSKTLRII